MVVDDEVEIGEAEVAKLGRDEGLENGGAAAILEEELVSGQHVTGLERAGVFGSGFDFGHKAADGRETRSPARGAQRAVLLDPGDGTMRKHDSRDGGLLPVAGSQ